MARTYVSSLLSKLHGRVGDIVVKKYKYGEVVSRVPRMGAVPPSDKQLARQEKWRAAGEYYRKVKANPALEACYAGEVKKTGLPLSAITNRDFQQPPKIWSIGCKKYTGRPGDVIEVKATDDVFVARVTVTLRDAAGAELESGPACCEETYLPWKYRAKTDVTGKGAITIEAVAEDLPGNRTARSETWPGTTIPAAAAPAPAAPSVATKPLSTPPVNDWDPRAE